MVGKRATKPSVLLKKETFNDMQRRIEQLEARLSQLYQRDHQSQLLVRNSQSSDWPQFAVVQLLSPIPATGLHFNESKLITAEITPDLHVYDPEITYAVVQYKVPKISNSVPGTGPGVVTGLTSALFVAGADDTKTYAIPSTQSGKFDTTDDATPFKLVGIDAATDVGKIIIQGGAAGEVSNWVEGHANAAFDTATTTITITVDTVIRGDAALDGTNVSMPNPFPFSGASERTYAGVANCYIQAMQADDGTWRLIEIAPTKCLCEDTNDPGSGTP